MKFFCRDFRILKQDARWIVRNTRVTGWRHEESRSALRRLMAAYRMDRPRLKAELLIDMCVEGEQGKALDLIDEYPDGDIDWNQVSVVVWLVLTPLVAAYALLVRS